MRRFLATFLIWTWFASHAVAATLDGATLPDTVTADGQTLVLNGMGLRAVTMFNLKVYVAGLYLRQLSHDARTILDSSGPKVVILKFLRAVSRERIERQFHQGEEENCGHGECDPSDAADYDRLTNAMPAMPAGGEIVYTISDAGLRAVVDGKLIGDFANRDLAYRVLFGFIGAHPPTPELRQAMLGDPQR